MFSKSPRTTTRPLAVAELAAVSASVRLAQRAGATPSEIAEAVNTATTASPAAWLKAAPANDVHHRDAVINPLRARILELVRLGPGQRVRELSVRLAGIDTRWDPGLVARTLRGLCCAGFLRTKGRACATAYFPPTV